MFAALGTGVAALALALLGYTFPGVIAGAAAAWMGGRAWSEANRDVALVALGCGGWRWRSASSRSSRPPIPTD